MNMFLLSLIIMPLAAAAIIQLVKFLHVKAYSIIGLLTIFLLFCMSVYLFIVRPVNGAMIYNAFATGPSDGIPLMLDGLSALFMIMVNFIGLMVAVFSFSYMGKFSYKNIYWSLLLIVIGSLNGIILNGDILNLYIFLEISCIASAALIAFGVREKGLEAAFKYLVMSLVASVIMALGIALAYWLAGSTNLAHISVALSFCPVGTKTLIVSLLLFGCASKASLVPFLAWLPDAHQCAPAPISAFLSGVLIKASGVYVVIRLCYNVFGMTYPLSKVLLVLGALSILIGSFLAIGQRDMKRLLGFSSISQIGYIILGVGLATPMGALGGLFHLFNHSLFKPLLFLNAGAVEHSTGTRNIEELGGLGQKMPVTGMTSMVGSLAISGMPPFNGFWSKLFIIIACVQAGHIGLALIAVLGSILTLAYMLKVQKKVFFGDIPHKLKNIGKLPFSMGLPMILLALLCLLTGVFFQWVIFWIISPAIASMLQGLNYAALLMGGV